MCLKVKIKHEVRSAMGQDSSALKREWPSLRKCPGSSARGQQPGVFTGFASKGTAPSTVASGTWKAILWTLHALHNSAQLPVALHCPWGMEMSLLQPLENLLGSFQAIVRSYWQQTSRFFFLLWKQNKYVIHPWFYFKIYKMAGNMSLVNMDNIWINFYFNQCLKEYSQGFLLILTLSN